MGPKTRRVEYIGGGFKPGEFPDSGLPEVAFLGRSNVGKSSLINSLVGQRQLARVSRTPGRTQAIHFFSVAGRFCLVDFPGYGYAAAPKRVREQWRPLAQSYLDGREGLCGGLLLVDVRREPRDEEQEIVRWFGQRGLPLVGVVTKVDKIAKSRRKGRVQQLRAALAVGAAVGFSAQDRIGRDALWAQLTKIVEARHGG